MTKKVHYSILEYHVHTFFYIIGIIVYTGYP